MTKIKENEVLPDYFDLVVDIYLDGETGKAYQVDRKRSKYREGDGKTCGEYSEWKSC